MSFAVRVPGYGGAAVFIDCHLAPGSLVGSDAPELVFDVGFLSPEVFLQYFHRRADPELASLLGDFFLRAAGDFYPEQSLPTLTDERMGLQLSVQSSSEDRVTIDASIIPDMAAAVTEPEGVNFETSRAALVSCAHAAARLAGDDPGYDPGEA